MATILFTNTLPANPGLEDVLDPSGTITGSSTEFAITNATGGTWNGFVFRFTGTGFGYSDMMPTSGTITGVTVFDASANIIATATGSFGDAALADTWSALQSDGALAALDRLFSGSDSITGSDSVDHLATLGSNDVDSLSGGAGDDVLWARSGGVHTLVGGAGSDLFRLDTGLNSVAGSAQDGSGGAGETNVVELGASGSGTTTNIQFTSITNIEGLRFAAPADGLTTRAILQAGQIGDGLLSLTLAVEGSTNNSSDSIEIADGTTPGVADLDLSGWTFSNWTRANQTVEISLLDDTIDHHIVGPSVAAHIDTGAGNDTIIGGAGDDELVGAAGDDLISGGAGTNLDLGGPGDDTYVVVSLTDVIVEPIGGGNDLVYVRVSGYTLPADVETLWLTGGATSGFGNNASGNTLVGNAAVNSSITGGAGADLLVGAHTAAITTMTGGAGDDVYVTFNSSDVIQESPGAGNDTVYAAVDYIQPGNVETLWLVGSATHGTGNNSGGTLVANNNLSSTITGGASADLLVGAHDVTSTLAGGGGDDTYVVFNSGDTVQEQPNGGNDIVYATADFTLPANIETLWLIGGATHATSNSSGGTLVANNNLNSVLTGGSGSDLLVGGHSSVTTMAGGQGNDTYVSFVAGDVVQEAANAGNDSLVTYVSQTIPDNVETMFLAEGAGAINGTGGSGPDTIIGNAFDNVLDGKGGLDILVGGGGNDTFVFKAGDVAGDIVTDFTSGQDKLQFMGYGAGTLTQVDATHWQINSASGLIHDILTLQNEAAVHAGDFLFV